MALRQLTDAPGLIIEADRSFSVELVRVFEPRSLNSRLIRGLRPASWDRCAVMRHTSPNMKTNKFVDAAPSR